MAEQRRLMVGTSGTEDSLKKTILVAGDAQARGVAMVLEKLAPITAKYRIEYRNAAAHPFGKEDLADTSLLLQQTGSGVERRAAKGPKRVTFPTLRFGLLWPLATVNPYNRPEPDEPHGPYPFGDSFIIAALESDLDPQAAFKLYAAGRIEDAWPNFDLLFKAETAALLAADANADVKLGSYVLKYFRKRRLFWAPNAPSNDLLGELIYRLLHAGLGPAHGVDRAALDAAFAALSARDVMSHIAIPIHPLIAEHFGLEWYVPGEPYPCPKGTRTFDEYYRGMIDYVLARRHERPAAAGRKN